VIEIATGWTENRSVRNKAEKWLFEALMQIRAAFPFPIIGIDSDNGSEFINWHLLRWCEQNQMTFTRSRSGNSNDGAHVEQKNWAGRADRGRLSPVRHGDRVVAAERDLVVAVVDDELLLPAAEADLQDPQRREGDQEYDQVTTPHRRADRHEVVATEDKNILADTYRDLNPAAIQRQIQALSEQLLVITTGKSGPGPKPPTQPRTRRASTDESTMQASRAS